MPLCKCLVWGAPSLRAPCKARGKARGRVLLPPALEPLMEEMGTAAASGYLNSCLGLEVFSLHLCKNPLIQCLQEQTSTRVSVKTSSKIQHPRAGISLLQLALPATALQHWPQQGWDRTGTSLQLASPSPELNQPWENMGWLSKRDLDHNTGLQDVELATNPL